MYNFAAYQSYITLLHTKDLHTHLLHREEWVWGYAQASEGQTILSAKLHLNCWQYVKKIGIIFLFKADAVYVPSLVRRDVQAYADTTKFRPTTILSTNENPFNWSAVLWLVKRSLNGRNFGIPSCDRTPELRNQFKWPRLKSEFWLQNRLN